MISLQVRSLQVRLSSANRVGIFAKSDARFELASTETARGIRVCRSMEVYFFTVSGGRIRPRGAPSMANSGNGTET